MSGNSSLSFSSVKQLSLPARTYMDNLHFIQPLIVIITGLILGSFFNVLIYRLPKGESIILPGSRCPSCGRPIPSIENIPIFSYLFLRGKCAGCKVKISFRYPLIEFITASLSLLLWYTLVVPFISENQNWWDYVTLIFQIATLLILIPVSVIDYYHYIIPDSISLSGLILGIAVSFIPGQITPVESFIGMIVGGGTLILIGLMGQFLFKKKEAMGGGDIKLMAFIGAVLGWKIALLTIIFGALFGSIIGLILIIIKFLPEDHKIPFGPFLGFGAWIACLFGDTIVTAYFNFIERLFF